MRRRYIRYQLGGKNAYVDQQNDQIDAGLTGAVSTINPLWGALAGAGSAASKKVMGDGSNQNAAIASDVLDPWNQFKNNDNLGDWAMSFGLPGISSIFKGKKNADRKQDELAFQRSEEQGMITDALNAKNLNYDKYGNQEDSIIYALGGSLKQLNSDTVEAEGNTHAEGGIKLPEAGAEVEDNETIANDYVFSDILGFADRHKTIARQIGKIEKKPLNRERRVSLEILRKKEAALRQEQEEVKSELATSMGVFQLGGSLKNSLTDGSAVTEPEGVPASPTDIKSYWNATKRPAFKTDNPMRTPEDIKRAIAEKDAFNLSTQQSLDKDRMIKEGYTNDGFPGTFRTSTGVGMPEWKQRLAMKKLWGQKVNNALPFGL